MQDNLPSTHLVLKNVRLCYPALFEPKPVARGETKTAWQCVALLDEDYDLKPLHAALKAAMVDKFGEVIKLPAAKNPIKPAGERDYQGFEDGMHYISLSNKFNQPPCVDRMGRPVTDPDVFYSGCRVNIYVNAYAWNNDKGGKGVSFGLNAVQFAGDDERLDGRRDPMSVFQPLGDDGTASDAGVGADDGDDIFG